MYYSILNYTISLPVAINIYHRHQKLF